MERSELKQLLRESLDMACLRRDMILSAAFVAAALALSGLFGGVFRDPVYWSAAALTAALVLIPLWGYLIWMICRIYRRPDSYSIYRTTLSSPHGSGWYRGSMYFTVILEDPADGRKTVANTRPIFMTWGIGVPLLEDYINKTVTVAYNEETDTVIVIG